jgi:branched-chain amino acid transport system ATP-binding protein
LLKVNNISTGYGKKQVLYDISMDVKSGDVVLLTGGNGSGKSTLFKCIFSLLPLWSGEIYFQNEKLDQKEPSDLIRNGMVYIPQKDFYFENLSVEENLQISGNTLPKNELKGRIQKVYQLTGLSKYRKRKPFNLSGGERKILAFGMALIHKPRLLLIDELFAEVDEKNIIKLIDIFNETIINKNNSVLIIEHKNTRKQLYNSKIVMELGRIKNNQ